MVDVKFLASDGLTAGDVTFENTGTEPFVGLRYFGPNAQPDAPAIGAYKK